MNYEERIQILVVEDEEDWSERLSLPFDNSVCCVHIAKSHQEGIETLRDRDFDLAFINILLRGETYRGWRLDWTNLLGEADRKDVDVIVITAMDEAGTIPKAEIYEETYNYDVVKGVFFKGEFTRRKLEQKVEQILIRPGSFESEIDRALRSRKSRGEPESEKPQIKDKRITDLTWLHLSDLHFKDIEARKYEIQEVVKALREDLRFLREKKGLEPDLIFFTGDLTYKAQPQEFKSAIKDYLGEILSECRLSYNELFIIPGNHDINRSSTTNLDMDLVRGLRSASQIHALLEDENQQGYRRQLFQRMQCYQDELSEIEGWPFDPQNLSWGQTVESRTGKILGIIGLNSTWTSASVKGIDGNVVDRGELIVGKPLVEKAIEQINKSGSQPDVSIAIMHHPLDWLRDWDKQNIEQFFLRNCQFVLHGHVHKTRISFLGGPSPRTMIISAGALFKQYGQEDIHTCLHAYNIVQLDLSKREGTIYFRRFDPGKKRYGMDDTSFPSVRDGQYSFKFRRDGFRSRE